MSHTAVYGDVVSGAPRSTPSSRNCTLETPTLSVAVAVTVTEPDTVDPPAGAEIATFGEVVSALLTVTATSADTFALPARSRATAVSWCGPFTTSCVFQVTV